MSETIKKIDMFASPYQLKFKNRDTFPTVLGGFLTILIISLSFAVAISSGDKIYNRVKPQINRNLVYQNTAKNYSLLNEFLPFYFYLNFDFSYDPSYITFDLNTYQKVVITNSTTGLSVETKERVSIEWELCSDNLNYHLSRFNNNINNNNNNITTTLLSNNFLKGICIKDNEYNRKIVLGGHYSSEYFRSLYLTVLKCDNSTSTVTCQSNDKLSHVFKSISLNFNVVENLVNNEDFNNPFIANFYNTFVKLDSAFYVQTTSYFCPIEVISDIGLLFTQEVKDEKLTRDEITSYFSYQPSDNVLARWYVQLSTKIDKYNRYYMKLQELAALVGGIINVLLVVSYFFASVFNNYLREKTMINTFFKVNYNSFGNIMSKNAYKNYDNKRYGVNNNNNNNSSNKNRDRNGISNYIHSNNNNNNYNSNNCNGNANDNHENRDIVVIKKLNSNKSSNINSNINNINYINNKVNVNSHSNIKNHMNHMNILNNKLSLSFDNDLDEQELKGRISLFNNIDNSNKEKIRENHNKNIFSNINSSNDIVNNISNKNNIRGSSVNLSLNNSNVIKNNLNNSGNVLINNNQNKLKKNISNENNSNKGNKDIINNKANELFESEKSSMYAKYSNLLTFKKSIFCSKAIINLDDNKEIIDNKKNKHNKKKDLEDSKKEDFYFITYLDIIGIFLCSCFDNCKKKKKYHKLLNTYLMSIIDYEEIITETSIFKELRIMGYFSDNNKNTNNNNNNI